MRGCVGEVKEEDFFFVNETRVATIATMGSVSGWGSWFWRKVVEICD